MAKFLVFMVTCLIVVCQITPSFQLPSRRVVRQDDVAFPNGEEGAGEVDTENRFGWWNNNNNNNNNNGNDGRRPGNNGWGNGGNGQNGWGNGGNGQNGWGNGGNGQNGQNGQNANQQNGQRPTTTPAPPTTAATAVAANPDCLRRCPVTPEYNPVCGTNRETYTNMSRLECARQCGLSIQFLRTGTCRPLPATTDDAK